MLPGHQRPGTESQAPEERQFVRQKFIVPREISQLYLALLDGAHHTDDVGEDLIRGIRLQGIILAAMGDIVAVTGQEQQITAVPHVQTIDHLAVKGLPGLVVLQLRIPQCGEQAVLLAVCHLLGGEYDVDEVFSQRTGQSLLQKAQILLSLLLGHHPKGFVQIRNDLFAAIDKTAVDPADSVFLRPPAAAQLIQFLLYHGRSAFLRDDQCDRGMASWPSTADDCTADGYKIQQYISVDICG